MDTSVTPNIYPAYMNDYERTLLFREQLRSVGFVPILGEPSIYVKADTPDDTDLFSLPISEACDLFAHKDRITSWAENRGVSNRKFVLDFSRHALERLEPNVLSSVDPDAFTMVDVSSADDYTSKGWIPRDKLLASKIVQTVFNTFTETPIVFLQFMTNVRSGKKYSKNEFDAVKPSLFGIYDFTEFVFTEYGTLISIAANERYQKILELPGDTQRILLALHGTDSLKVVSAHPMVTDELVFKLAPGNYAQVLSEYGFKIHGDPQTYLMRNVRLFEPVLTRSEPSYEYDDSSVTSVMLDLQNLTDDEIIYHFGVGFKFSGRMNLFSEIFKYSHNETFLFPQKRIAFGVVGTPATTEEFIYTDYSIDDLMRLIDIYRTFDPVPLATIIEIEYTIINPKKDDLNFTVDDPTVFEKLYLFGATSNPDYLEEAKEAVSDDRILKLRTLFYDPVNNGYLYSLLTINDVLNGAKIDPYNLMLTAYVMARQLSDTLIVFGDK